MRLNDASGDELRCEHLREQDGRRNVASLINSYPQSIVSTTLSICSAVHRAKGVNSEEWKLERRDAGSLRETRQSGDVGHLILKNVVGLTQAPDAGAAILNGGESQHASLRI